MNTYQHVTLPNFLIIGTQKAGTTWLMKKLGAHPDVFMAPRQLHFFDREFHRGLDWYCAQFRGAKPGQLAGEKTTEYFDTTTIPSVAERVAHTLPDGKLVVILRNPLERAWSAMVHHVNAGLLCLPHNPDLTVFDNAPQSDPSEPYFRFIERGYYAQQLRILYDYVDPSRVLVLIFEDDIVGNPLTGWEKVCRFLNLPVLEIRKAEQPENRVRLSPLACRVSYYVRKLPFGRGVVRRLDRLLGLEKWAPRMSTETRTRLEHLYAQPNRELYDLLGYEITSWKDMT